MRSYNLTLKISKIEALLLDVDGVLTPGDIWYSDSGDQFKSFDVKDGLSIAALRELKMKIGIITGKHSDLVGRRAGELNISDLYQNSPNKIPAFEDFMAKHGLVDEQVAFVGDDVIDAPVMARCGFSACPSDASAIAKRTADWVSRYPAGHGAVREIAEIIIAAKTGEYPPDRFFLKWVENLPERR